MSPQHVWRQQKLHQVNDMLLFLPSNMVSSSDEASPRLLRTLCRLCLEADLLLKLPQSVIGDDEADESTQGDPEEG